MMQVKVYVMTHKKYDQLKKYLDDSYVFMQLGSAINPRINEYLTDDHKTDSISHKNPYYSELTGLYHIYKHTTDRFVGLIHYRRFFSGKRFSIFSYKALTGRQIEKHLLNHDIILPKKTRFRMSLYENYKHNHYIKDIELTRSVIEKLYPNYLKSFNQHMQGKKAYIANMFIGKKDIIDQYSKWLFDILFELEKLVDISSYDTYQKRIYGFISERLFNVWLDNHILKIKEIPIITTELNPFKEFLKDCYRSIFGVSGISNTKKR